jgi:RNA-splicing ligase RtcB
MIIQGESTNADVKIEQIDDYTREQIQEMVDHEAFQNPVSIMPDTHAGAGAVIGFTMPVDDRVVPNTIGVDIGCGMYAVNFGPDPLPDEDSHVTDEKIRTRVPMGSSVHDDQNNDPISHVLYQANTTLEAIAEQHAEPGGLIEGVYTTGGYDRAYYEHLCESVGMDEKRATDSLGTLGGGNHFIELGRSTNTNDLWCIIHSGSRQLGLKIAQYWQEIATEQHDRLDFGEIPEGDIDYLDADGSIHEEAVRADHEGEAIGEAFDRLQSYKPSRDRNTDLDYLEGSDVEGYILDMIFAQAYASVSRKLMAAEVAEALGGREFVDTIESVHNYIDFEDYTIRKGATRAYEGERAIIPFNMRDGTLIVEGEGNPTWNYSAPHGAGRVMSRREAKRRFTQEDADAAMEGITATKTPIDEAPMSYKPARVIEEAIEPTATIVDRIEPVLNIKA